MSKVEPHLGGTRNAAGGGHHGLLLALLLVVVLLVPYQGDAAARNVGARPDFTWSMEPRFGLDVDDDGVIEIENTPEYAHNRSPNSCAQACPPAGFAVQMEASPSPNDLGLPESGFISYEWRITTDGAIGVYHSTHPTLNLRLPEGDHAVDLRVTVRLPWGRVTSRARGTMVVDDLLVVALGDSYASGEGNPNVGLSGDDTAVWADATDPTVRQHHATAHRSTVGWPAQTALAIEDASPQTSVTFIDLAASGATINRGILGSRSDPPTAAQLDELGGIVGSRRIDLLLVQVGGNDVGFSKVIRALVQADPLLNPFCYEVMVDNAWRSAVDGIWDRGVRLTYDPPLRLGCRSTPGTDPTLPGLEGLEANFGEFQRRLEGLSIGRVLLVEYPDPTGADATGGSCEEIVGDTTPPFRFHEVDKNEQALGIERVLNPLNRELGLAALRNGWEYVGGVASGFSSGHGYCAPWPDYGYPDAFADSSFLRRVDFPEGWYRPPGRFGAPLLLNAEEASWYRTATQSAALQGPVPRFLTSGTLHPNEVGHTAIARLVLGVINRGD